MKDKMTVAEFNAMKNKGGKKKRNDPEFDVYRAIAKYMAAKYPQEIWHFDLTGVGLTKAQAGKMKAIQNGDKYPDFFLAAKRGKYGGLYIEIKVVKSMAELKTAKGYLKTEHLISQQKTLHKLFDRGYYAVFGLGTDDCIEIIDTYMELK